MELSVFSIAAVFLSSLVAAMGLGGGTVLLLYLSFFSTLSQPQMQSLNLLLFLPAAALSLFFHWKNQADFLFSPEALHSRRHHRRDTGKCARKHAGTRSFKKSLRPVPVGDRTA